MRKTQAQTILRTVDEGIAFHFCNGQVAQNLFELFTYITELNTDEYQHHVYFDHNDFSNWIIDILDDQKLGLDIFNASKTKMLTLIKARILYLKHRASS